MQSALFLNDMGVSEFKRLRKICAEGKVISIHQFVLYHQTIMCQLNPYPNSSNRQKKIPFHTRLMKALPLCRDVTLKRKASISERVCAFFFKDVSTGKISEKCCQHRYIMRQTCPIPFIRLAL